MLMALYIHNSVYYIVVSKQKETVLKLTKDCFLEMKSTSTTIQNRLYETILQSTILRIS